MAKQKYKRRIYIIDPVFQYRMIFKSCLIGVVIIVMSLFFLAVVNHLYGDVEVTMLTQPNPFASDPTSASSEPQPTSLLSLLWPVMAVSVGTTLVFLFFFVMIASHRMAGPIFRIRRILRDMSDGDISGEVRLRKKDEFKHLAEEVDNLKVSLRAKVGQMLDITKNPDIDDDGCRKKIAEILSGFKTQ